MGDRTLDYIALAVLICVVVTIIYGIIFIHDIPYEIAKKRKHPHQDAIHTAGWVSLFLMHTIWPFLWVWATLYKPDYGWGFNGSSTPPIETDINSKTSQVTADLAKRVAELESLEKRQSETHRNQIKMLQKRISDLETRLQKDKES